MDTSDTTAVLNAGAPPATEPSDPSTMSSPDPPALTRTSTHPTSSTPTSNTAARPERSETPMRRRMTFAAGAAAVVIVGAVVGFFTLGSGGQGDTVSRSGPVHGGVTLSGALTISKMDPGQPCVIVSTPDANPISEVFSFTNGPTNSALVGWQLSTDVPRTGGTTTFPSPTYGVSLNPAGSDPNNLFANHWGISDDNLNSSKAGSGEHDQFPNGTSGTIDVTLPSDGSVKNGPVHVTGSWSSNGC